MKVFISYRRDDTASAAGRVYDRLCLLLKKSNVFFDVSAIKAGADFEQSIVAAMASSNAVLIFIGDKWLAPSPPTNAARIWEPRDYVHAEVRSALSRPITVLPILVGGARMPKAEELPEDIRAVINRNALPLRHESFDDDTENIIDAAFGTSAKRRVWEDHGRFWSRIAYAAGGVIAALAVMLVVALVHFWVLARPLSASIGGPLTTLILIAWSVLGALAGLRFEAWKRRSR